MKTLCSFCLFVLLSGLSMNSLFAQGFLHADGQKIVNGNGENVLLRGMGLGGYMLQEGYMFETSSFANTQHELKAKIVDLVGVEMTDSFYHSYQRNYVTARDIDSMAAWGFNSLRLPLHYNLFITEGAENKFIERGFSMIDQLLKWCEAKKIYLILDLHAAPGGQGNDLAISDRDPSKPSLWDSPENQLKTVILWKELARRYADKEWIGGYDLINETNWDAMKASQNKPLKDLYLRLTDSIRKVDKNHLIFIEGNSFANDFTGLTPTWDNNMAYSFHKYWNVNDQGSIQWVLDIRSQHNVPIWLGESGENSNNWFTDCIELLEKNNIGWAFWPMKKVSSVTGIMAVPKNDGYQNLLDYWGGKVSAPSELEATQALLELAENFKIENCIIHRDVLHAMFAQIGNSTITPFAINTVPGVVYASEYDMGRNGKAYMDSNAQNTNYNTWGWNAGYAYRNDGVDIEACTDAQSNGYDVGWTENSEWIKYTVVADKAGSYSVSMRVAGLNAGEVTLKSGATFLVKNVTIPATSGWQTWKSVDLGVVNLVQGKNEIMVIFNKGGFNFNSLNFQISTALPEVTSSNFTIYPNPAQQNLTVDAAQSFKGSVLAIKNANGVQVSSQVVDKLPCNINVSELPRGVYFLSVKEKVVKFILN